METNKEIQSLESFIAENRADMLADLMQIVEGVKSQLKSEPSLYMDNEDFENPSIDVRLCIDLTPSRYRSTGWIIRTGLVDYDPYFSEFCAASCVTFDTDPKELLDELIGDILNQPLYNA